MLSTWRSSSSSRWISNRLSSAWSSSTSLRGADARDLAAQLGADRAAGAGDEHDLGRSGSAPTRSSSIRTGSRPRTSSTSTSRTWRMHGARRSAAARTRSAACAPGRRARGRRATTRARSVPGADGIAIRTSSGSTSSSTRAELRRSSPSTSSPRSTRAPLLARVVVDEADRAVAELRVAHDLAQQQAAAVAGADDQHRARVACARGSRAAAARRARATTKRAPPRKTSISSPKSTSTPVGTSTTTKPLAVEASAAAGRPRRRPTSASVGDDAACGDLQVVALRRVAHPVPVEAEQREARRRCRRRRTPIVRANRSS